MPALALVLATLQPAHATIITQPLFGHVTLAAENNPFSLKNGDILAGSVTFDSSVVTGVGFETFSAEDLTLQLDLQIGTFSFDQDDHRSFSNGPFLFFANGRLLGINFTTDFELPTSEPTDIINFVNFSLLFHLSVDGFTSFPFFQFLGPDGDIVSGEFAIPEPGTLGLIGAGLAGIGLLRRRRDGLRAA